LQVVSYACGLSAEPINSCFGALISEEAPAAIDKAFRLYQLPQGIFSVAVATVSSRPWRGIGDSRRTGIVLRGHGRPLVGFSGSSKI